MGGNPRLRSGDCAALAGPDRLPMRGPWVCTHGYSRLSAARTADCGLSRLAFLDTFFIFSAKLPTVG